MTSITDISRRGLLAATGAALATPGLALAQGRYPDRPIQLVVPWPAGGSADAQLRSIAELAGKALGQPMLPSPARDQNASHPFACACIPNWYVNQSKDAITKGSA